MYDIIIIGSGPAGLTAALYALRADKRVLVLEKENFGGQITFSPKVENYPAFIQISGNELAQKLMDQVMEHGADIELGEVTGIVCEPDRKKVLCTDEVYEARAVIIATGSRHRQLGLEGENELIGAGISYCAVCDGAFFNSQNVAIVGGGNTALQEAVLLSDICHEVTVIQNLPMLTGEGRLIRAIEAKPNVRVIYDSLVTGLVGEESLRAVRVLNTVTDEEQELAVDGLFVAIGQKPENEPFSSLVELDANGYVLAGEDCKTSAPGIFVAGDCRTKGVRQVTTAVADGATAALAACRYLDER